MKHLLLLAGMLALLCRANAQIPSDYKERSAGDALLPPAKWTQTLKTWRVGWGNTDTHYEKFDIAPVTSSPWQATAWRGEKVNAQAVLSTAEALSGVRLEASDLRSGRHTIPAAAVELSFVRYVLTDSLVNDQSGCGYRTDKSQWDTLLVADVLDTRPELDIAPCTTRPLWMIVTIPADARPGTYKGTLTVTARRSNGKTLRKTLPYEIRVSTRQLPPASQWQLHLDLWQNPYAVARYYNVPLWSEAHFDLMRPLMQRLADAGQKVITTTIMQYPWNGQTEDPFESMVFKMKRIDGTWTYDYTVFDRWVEFMMSLGIDRQINCYTIVPWSLSFDYFDQGSNTVRYLKAPIGSPEYNAYWLPFLRDFAAHLKAKGWFDRTYIALDERGMEETPPEQPTTIRKPNPAWTTSASCSTTPFPPLSSNADALKAKSPPFTATAAPSAPTPSWSPPPPKPPAFPFTALPPASAAPSAGHTTAGQQIPCRMPASAPG